MRIFFSDTHAYPGCRARGAALPRSGRSVPALAEFSDGSIAVARGRRVGDAELRLAVRPYATARGTKIAAKTWVLRLAGGDRWVVAAKPRAKRVNARAARASGSRPSRRH